MPRHAAKDTYCGDMIRESVNRVVASAESGVKLGNGNLDQSAVGDIQRDLARYCASDVGKALNAA